MTMREKKRKDVGYVYVVCGEEASCGAVSGNAATDVVSAGIMFVPKYTSMEQNVLWARKGLVVTVLNGEAISMIQHRIYDDVFEKLVIIPLGANKVLLRMEDDSDVSSILTDAAEFFNNFFSHPVSWKKDLAVHERGAWVRIYGVPLHAWNQDLFLSYVFMIVVAY